MGNPAAISRLLRRARSVAAELEAESMPAPAAAANETREQGLGAILATIRRSDGRPARQGPRPAESGETYALLGELDRLWQAPSERAG